MTLKSKANLLIMQNSILYFLNFTSLWNYKIVNWKSKKYLTHNFELLWDIRLPIIIRHFCYYRNTHCIVAYYGNGGKSNNNNFIAGQDLFHYPSSNFTIMFFVFYILHQVIMFITVLKPNYIIYTYNYFYKKVELKIYFSDTNTYNE